MTDWNPNDPQAVGIEYLAELQRSWTIGSTGGAENGVGQRFRSSVSETIDHLSVFATAVTGSGYMLAELLVDGDEDLSDIAIDAVAPTVATNVVNLQNQAGSTTPANLIASIDETGDPPNAADFISYLVSGAAQSIDLQFSGAAIAAATTGRRVLGVAIGIQNVANSPADFSDHCVLRVVSNVDGAQHIVLDRALATGVENWVLLGELWRSEVDTTVEPAPWNETNLAEFASGGGDLVFRIASVEPLRISRVRMVIVTADENRAAVAVLRQSDWEYDLPASTADGLVGRWAAPVPVREPDGAGGNWSKATATTYRAIYRRAILGDGANNLAVTVPVIGRYDGEVPPPGTFLDAPIVTEPTTVTGPATAATPGTLAVAPDGARDPLGGAVEPVGIIGVRLYTNSGADDSVDGQPYAQLIAYPINTTDGAEYQLVTSGAGGDYTAVRVPVGFASTAGPDGDLTVQIRDATGVTTLATGTLTAAEYRTLPAFSAPNALHEVIIDVAVTLAPATQYRVRFSSSASEDDGWLIGVLTVHGAIPAGDSTNEGAATYGGETDYFSGGVPGDPEDDAVVLLGLGIDGPTNLSVEGAAQSFAYADPCGIEEVPYAHLEWDASSAGADFARYRVQRRDSIDDQWADVAYLTSESIAELSDVEARLGMESEWRLRSEGPDGQTSLWTDIEALTLATVGCGYTFTAMALPLQSVGYVDVYDQAAERGYDFPDADEALVRTFAGRDEFVVFRPLERRSVRFTRRLLTKSFRGTFAGLVGPAAFDALRELCRSAVPPYICVRDESGNRWFAAVLVRDGSVLQPSDTNRCSVEVIPTSSSPVAPTIEG